MHLPARLVKEKAYDLGFNLVGSTTPEPSQNLPVYDAWLASGYHGEMMYLANGHGRSARADLNQILAGCRAVLSLGWRHPSLLPLVGI